MEIKLKLKVKDVEIELTQDEAMELADALNKLTGKPEKEYINGWHYPYYWDVPKWEYNPNFFRCDSSDTITLSAI